MSGLGNGSPSFSYSEILPNSAQDHSLSDITKYASKMTGGRKRTRKYKGGDLMPLEFSEFSADNTAPSSMPSASSAMGLALNHPAAASTMSASTMSNHVNAGALGSAASSTMPHTLLNTPTISKGGARTRRRRKSSKKRSYKKGGKRSSKRSSKKKN